MSQTVVQHPETIRIGSAKLEIGMTEDTLVDVGAMTGVKFTHDLGTKSNIKSDNAGIILEKVGGQTAAIEGNLMEINLDILAQYLRGLNKIEVIPGGSVDINNEPHVLPSTQFIRLNHRSNNAMVTNVDVVTAVGSINCEVDVDYYLAIDADGFSCIARNPASTKIADGDEVLVDYSYVATARKRLSVGGLQKLDASVARLTNRDSLGRILAITVFKATADTGIAIEFKADDAEETNVVPIKLLGTEDTSRALGEQLFVIDDEQL